MKKASTARGPARAKDAPLQTLAREVAGLRITFREICAKFQLRAEAELAAIQEALDDAHRSADPQGARWDRFARHSLTSIRSTRLRPKKGRLKDLARISRLTTDLLKELP